MDICGKSHVAQRNTKRSNKVHNVQGDAMNEHPAVSLELKLHDPTVRNDKIAVSSLLHEHFSEIGKSGSKYTKQDVLDHIGVSARNIWSRNYCCIQISDVSVLLTYECADIDDSGALANKTYRSSIWILHDNNWQLLFHQAMPTSDFNNEET